MAILITEKTRLLVQGATGGEGSLHTRLCKEFGTNVVAGVTPGREGGEVHGVPVFNTVDKAVRETRANASIIFVPAAFATSAMYEAIDAGLELVVTITDGTPTLDMVNIRNYIRDKNVTLIGPNCPGLISPPAKAKAGIMPSQAYRPGRIGMVTRSGTLLYDASAQVSAQGLGQSTAVGIGGDPVPGTTMIKILRLLNADPDTDGIVLIGEIGGTAEIEAAEYIKAEVKKPVVAFIAGASAPPGRRMGHAGAIISGGRGTADEKYAALEAAGVVVSRNPAEIGLTIARVMQGR